MQAFTKGFGIIGLIFLIFGLIALALTKLLNWYVYTHLGLGVLLIILYIVFNFDSFRERMRERSTTEGSKVFVYAGIGVLIIIVLNVVSFRHSWRWDSTSSKVFSLEEQTLNVLKNLKSPVQFTAFYHSKNQLREPFKALAGAYAYKSNNFQYETVDPDKRPELATRYQVKDGDIRVVYGPNDKTLRSYDEKQIRESLKENVKALYFFSDLPNDENYQKLHTLLQTPEFSSKGVQLELLSPTSPAPPGVDIKDPSKGSIYVQFMHKDTVIKDVSEEVFTNAMMQVARQTSPVVRFVTGHGERDLTDENESGLTVLKGAIQNEGYVVQPMEGSLVQGVTPGTDILVVAGPRGALSKEEADSVDRFLEGGGKVIIMADPNISNPKLSPQVILVDSGMENLLEKWGVTLGKDLVLEKHMQIFSGQTTDPDVYAMNYAEHEITKPLTGRSTFFHVARSVRKSSKAASGLKVTELIKSSPQAGNSWAETNLTELIMHQKAVYDDKDIAAPVSIAVVSERTKNVDGKTNLTKLIVFGDVDFATNQFIRTQEFNYDLFLNSLNWMWGRQEQISIRPKQLRSSKLLLTPEQTNIIFYAAVLTIPELVLIAGLVIYWRRRSR